MYYNIATPTLRLIIWDTQTPFVAITMRLFLGINYCIMRNTLRLYEQALIHSVWPFESVERWAVLSSSMYTRPSHLQTYEKNSSHLSEFIIYTTHTQYTHWIKLRRHKLSIKLAKYMHDEERFYPIDACNDYLWSCPLYL